MMYLDLSELDRVFHGHWLWSTRRLALARFRRRDHLGDPTVPLDEAVRDLVARSGAPRPRGPIRLLTHLRYAGYGMNPVSFFYCYDDAETKVPQTIVAEVSNTPWDERHCYVLTEPREMSPLEDERSDMSPDVTVPRALTFELEKAFHVSPFMPMEIDYRWRFTPPADRLVVHMENRNTDGARVFDATLDLRRRPIDGLNLARVLFRHPFMTARVVAWIYLQASLLWLKRVPFFSHPAGKAPTKK